MSEFANVTKVDKEVAAATDPNREVNQEINAAAESDDDLAQAIAKAEKFVASQKSDPPPAADPAAAKKENPGKADAPNPDPAKAGEPGKESIADRISRLTQTERRILDEKRKIAADRKAIEQERTKTAELEAELSRKLKEHDELINAYKTNPKEALKKAGWDYQKLTELELSGEEITPEMALKAAKEEISSIKDELKRRDEKAAEDAKNAAAEETRRGYETYVTNTANFVKTNKDKYDLLAAIDEAFDGAATKTAVAGNQAYFAQNKKALSHAELAELTQKGFVDDMVKIVKASPTLQAALKELLGAPNTNTNPNTNPNKGTEGKSGSKTLMNSGSPSISAGTNVGSGEEVDEYGFPTEEAVLKKYLARQG